MIGQPPLTFSLYSYPPFPPQPQSAAGIGNFILAFLIWIVEVPLITIANVIIGIGNGVSNSGQGTAEDIINYLGRSFQNSVSSLAIFGAAAPIVASIIWGTSIIIIVFLIFKAAQIAADQITNME